MQKNVYVSGVSEHQPHISHYIRICDGKLTGDGKLCYGSDSGEAAVFLQELYRYSGMQYPKFFKMDLLCKASLLAAELLLKQAGIQQVPAGASVILSNASSSLDTDLKHLASISEEGNFFPSPAVFVYTLPNIAVGEICIKYGIKGENGFFVFPAFDAGFLCSYIHTLFSEAKTGFCIGGWVEVFANTIDILLFIAETKDTGIPFEPEELNKIFATNETVWKNLN